MSQSEILLIKIIKKDEKRCHRLESSLENSDEKLEEKEHMNEV